MSDILVFNYVGVFVGESIGVIMFEEDEDYDSDYGVYDVYMDF